MLTNKLGDNKRINFITRLDYLLSLPSSLSRRKRNLNAFQNHLQVDPIYGGTVILFFLVLRQAEMTLGAFQGKCTSRIDPMIK